MRESVKEKEAKGTKRFICEQNLRAPAFKSLLSPRICQTRLLLASNSQTSYHAATVTMIVTKGIPVKSSRPAYFVYRHEA